MVVDDSIVRGTTSKHLVGLLRNAGAEEVYFISAAPAIKHPCIYGIDMSMNRELIAANYEGDQISQYIGADAVIYQPLQELRELYKDMRCCYACFSGEYPTGITNELLQQIEQEKICSNRV